MKFNEFIQMKEGLQQRLAVWNTLGTHLNTFLADDVDEAEDEIPLHNCTIARVGQDMVEQVRDELDKIADGIRDEIHKLDNAEVKVKKK